MCFTRILKRWRAVKTVFDHDVLNSYPLEYKDIFLKIMTTLSLLGRRHQRLSINKICKEAKTIILVDVWINSLMNPAKGDEKNRF